MILVHLLHAKNQASIQQRLTLRRRRRPGAFVAAIVLAVLVACSGAPGEAPASARLTNTLLRERFTGGRLAGQHEWQPCITAGGAALIPVSRCGEPAKGGPRSFARIADAERAARSELRSSSSTTALRASALLDLRWRDAAPTGVDRAVESLERARRMAPDNVVILNDLAVAYLKLGERDQHLMPLLRALDVIERARARDSAHSAVLFNRALILQRLYLLRSAEGAWERYLTLERHPGWRTEATARMSEIERAIDTVSWNPLLDHPPARIDTALRAEIVARVQQSPQAARDFSFRLLGRWGAATRKGDHMRAGRLLTLAREIGMAAEHLDADRSVALAVRSIDSLAPDTRRSRELALGHVQLAHGIDLYFKADYLAGSVSLGQAEQTLRSLGSPAARWAAFYQGASKVQLGEYTSADRRFQGVRAAGTAEEPALVGKAIWGLGVSHLRRGHHETATRFYRDAAPWIARARERENEGAISYLLSESLNLAGQSALGRAEVFRGLRILSPFRRSYFLNNHLTTLATYAREAGLGYAALAVMHEVLEVAHTLGKPDILAWALGARARDFAASGRTDAARMDLVEAERWADRLTHGPGRDRVRADVRLVLGQLTRGENPRSALPLLFSVVAAYRRMKVDLDLPAALYETAMAARAAGDPAGGRLHLQDAIEQIERQRASFETAEIRTAFYETVESVFDAMIDLELDERRPGSAFEYLERGREVARGASARGPDSRPAPARGTRIDEIRARLPESMLLVEYAVLRTRVVVWTVSRRDWRQHSVPVARDSVAALVDRFTRGTHQPGVGASDARARLFDLLIRPVAAELNGMTELTIVPDRELYGLPFAALRDESGRFLLERFQVRTVPSAAFYGEALSRARQVSPRESALVIGNPRLDTASVLRLPDLPGAEREARQVARLYGGARLLTGADARRVRVLEFLPEYSIFHFAGHAVFNSEQPELSYLALAPNGAEGDGILHAREIGALRLSNVRVVVLSACSTLSPRTSRVGVTAGLAHSFLRAGAPATISTLWDVSDQATTELMVEFHRQIAGGVPAVQALRIAQVQALRTDPPEPGTLGAWAAFIYTGP